MTDFKAIKVLLHIIGQVSSLILIIRRLNIFAYFFFHYFEYFQNLSHLGFELNFKIPEPIKHVSGALQIVVGHLSLLLEQLLGKGAILRKKWISFSYLVATVASVIVVVVVLRFRLLAHGFLKILLFDLAGRLSN